MLEKRRRLGTFLVRSTG